MNFTDIIPAYIILNIFIATGFISLVLYPGLAAGLFKKHVGAQALLKLHYAILSIVLILVLLYPVIPATKTFEPAARILAVQSMDGAGLEDILPRSKDNGNFFAPEQKRPFDKNNIKVLFSWLILLQALAAVAFILNDLRRLLAIRNRSFLIRKNGSVSIHANDRIKIPFSYWLPGMASVIIPTRLLEKETDYKIIVLHELEHHRNGDTRWLYLLMFLKRFCFLNPLVHMWCRLIFELQEFACDEVMVGKKKIDSKDYARCLFETAKSSSGLNSIPGCATALIFTGQRKQLKRRIEKIFVSMPVQLKWQANILVLLLITGQMASVAFASKTIVQTGRITAAKASEMTQRARAGATFPIVLNDLVLEELNAYLETPMARKRLNDAMERMKSHKKDIEAKMKEYGVPAELLALPLVESGYRNFVNNASKARGAGIWTFIPNTARAFGLTVNEDVDQRLDIDMLTDAAMRYLVENKSKFNDWPLAVMAYNMGESGLNQAIKKTGSRNVWDIIRAGYQNDPGYYAKFMAAVIIMKNPEIVTEKQ